MHLAATEGGPANPGDTGGEIMLRGFTRFAMIAAVAAWSGAGVARAQVGEPTGMFNIKIQHGGTTVVDTVTSVPLDHKISDGDPEDYVQIGTIGPNNAPIILKMVSDDDPNFRIVHWYIDVPGDLNNIFSSNGDSLFNPANPAPIDVTITGLSFTGTTEVTPLIVNNSTFLTAFMRDTFLGIGGRFYALPGTNLYAPGVLGPQAQAQVPGNQFFDMNAGQYAFSGSFAQPTATWSWLGLPNPGAVGAAAVNADGSMSPGDGRVFELGLSMAFVGVPEPGTLAMMLPAVIAMIRRRRRAP
jgi:hypothetical protein